MKQLNNISAYRILVLLLIGLYFHNVYIFLAEIILLCFYNFKESIVLILIIILIFLTNSIKTDYIPIGIVERKINNYYVVDKLLYKTKINNDDIDIGDIILTDKYELISDDNYLKKNIKYTNDEYHVINTFKIRKVLNNRIEKFNPNIKNSLNKFIYNISNYDDLSFNLGYGLAIYYLIKQINNKSKKVGFISIIIYSLLFYFDIKFYLLIFDYILDILNIKNKIPIKYVLICLINTNLLNNYSIQIPLFLGLFSHLSKKEDFKLYLIIIQSILFGYINILNTFIYKYYVKVQIILLLFSIVLLFIPSLETIYSFIISVYSNYNDLNLNIRGSISIIGFIIYLLFIYMFKVENTLIKIGLFILILISPFNNPFYHVSFIDVGQGDSILIKSDFNKANILIDTGSTYNYYKLKKYLFSQGVYCLDYLIITHNDSDHNGNVKQLSKDFKIKNIIEQPIDVKYKDINLTNLYVKEFDNDNDNSLVYYTNINDIGLLFTGDISSNCERLLVNKYSDLSVDILKASHHGSKSATSDYFVGRTLPKIAIISTSGMYGHPHASTIETLNNYLVKIYNTKQEKNIEIYFTKLANILKTDNLSFAIIK